MIRRKSQPQQGEATSFPPTRHEEDPRQIVNTPEHKTRMKQAKRTTKTSQKFTLFPEDEKEETVDNATVDEVYNQIGQLPVGTTRRDMEKMKSLKSSLPRVKAYCTAGFYKLDLLFKWFQVNKNVYNTNPKRFDECIYTPFSMKPQESAETLIDLSGEAQPTANANEYLSDLDTEWQSGIIPTTIVGELFMFEYGVLVCWGLSKEEEKFLLDLIVPFEEEKLASEDVEEEELRFVYTLYQQRIYNDIITLKSARNVMAKLTISHAIAQSAKMALFEELIETTIDETKYIPQEMAQSGTINLSRTLITKKIGQLFIMRINVNLVSNVLDEPEIFWSEPALQPQYQAVRGYLEISQRAELLNQRVEVISDLLEMLKDHLNYSHSEQLEWIIIYLITFEAVIGMMTVFFEVMNYRKD